MPRMSAAEKQKSHERILDAAARLFRERGIEATSVADVMKAAGLTHGGFYKHFPSKQALVAEAFRRAAEGLLSGAEAEAAPGRPARAEPRARYVARYLSGEHVSDAGHGCPIAALGADLRPFISYLGSHPDDEGPDPDGLDQSKRMQLEAKAIEKIIGLEPNPKQTAEGNKGFDLYEADAEGNVIRWIEVKSMTGSLNDRPVGLSRAQFDLALQRREAFWLYVVENASEMETARVVKIQDPAGRARTFTFDSGWLSTAETIPEA